MSRFASFAVFITTFFSLLGGIHYYLWTRLVRATVLPPPWRTVATIALVVLALSLPTALIVGRLLSPPWNKVLALPAFTWLGVMFLLSVLLLVGDAFRLVQWALAHMGGDSPASPERRAALARAIAGVAGAAVAAVSVAGIKRALGPVRVRDLEIKLARLPAARDGTTIVQLTDLHVGPTIGRAFIEDIVRRTNALAPDIVAITGDLVDGSVADLRDAVAPLAGLRAKHGVFFITGNHEYYSGVGDWLAHLPTLGMRVLRNERVAIGGDGADGFDLAGVDDHSATGMGVGHGPDVAKAMAGRDTSREVVLLAHQPKEIHEAARHGVGLQLSGHTHAGQVWPFSLLVKLAQPYIAGLHRHGDTQIYVSPGTGYWGPPMRVATTPEITRVTLRRG